MREILFKGKTERGKWVEGDYQSFIYGDEDKCHIIGVWGEFSEYDIIPETIGQYTGLTDKNGKKIFEGDVVRVYFVDGDEVGEIVYANSAFRFKCEDGVPGYCIDDTLECEVIGNIHDNPELLKKKECGRNELNISAEASKATGTETDEP